ncbi:MAG: hypothetical protein P8L68_18890 [Paracoccaceae bacterium]|nr:hypothetical protein [Paracoccaceae bacterium]
MNIKKILKESAKAFGQQGLTFPLATPPIPLYIARVLLREDIGGVIPAV